MHTYYWDFGDGSPIDNNAYTTHTYLIPGTYTICHTIETYLEFGEDDDILTGKKKNTEMIGKYKVNGYIADMRNFKGASPEAAFWVANTWFPEVYKLGLKKGAFIFGEDLFSHFAVETAVSSEIAKKMKLEKFLTIEEAEKWLASN